MRHELSAASLTKLISFLFWNWMYFLAVENAPNKSLEWCSRIVTLLHGTFATLGGLTQCKWQSLTPWHLTRRILPCQYMLMVWSWGYFAFDLLWCLVNWTDSSVVMLCHHTTALFAITRYMQKDHTGCTFALVMLRLLGWQLVGPSCPGRSQFLRTGRPLDFAAWFLKTEGYGTTTMYFVVEVVYLAMFLALRGILGTYLMYWIFKTNFFDWEEKILSLIFYLVSMTFVYDIASYIRYKYKHEISDFREFYYATCLPNDFEAKNVRTQTDTVENLKA